MTKSFQDRGPLESHNPFPRFPIKETRTVPARKLGIKPHTFTSAIRGSLPPAFAAISQKANLAGPRDWRPPSSYVQKAPSSIWPPSTGCPRCIVPGSSSRRAA